MTVVDQIDRFPRLALKAQGQCHATLETLARMKSPPAVFARLANIAQGPQQVNNTLNRTELAPAAGLARAGNHETEQKKLLEVHGGWLDSSTVGTSVIGDQALATVGTRHRPMHSGGQGAIAAECRSRGTLAHGPAPPASASGAAARATSGCYEDLNCGAQIELCGFGEAPYSSLHDDV